jgi:hypothetical protein
MWKCVELIEVSSVDECCNIKTDCKIFRTKEKLPPSLVSSWGPIIRDVTAIDGFTSLIMLKSTDWNRKLEDTNFKYDKDLYYFHQDGYLYFPNLKWKKIRVEAYFEEDIDKYNTCSDQQDPCKTFLDNKFIIPKELLDPCIKMVEAEIFNFYERLPEDEQPDKNSTRKN